MEGNSNVNTQIIVTLSILLYLIKNDSDKNTVEELHKLYYFNLGHNFFIFFIFQIGCS